MRTKVGAWLLALYCGLGCGWAAVDADHCFVCQRPLLVEVITYEDKITSEKVRVCRSCSMEAPDCFLCGVPAWTNAPGFLALADGRAICERDAKTVVLREDEALQICRDVHNELDHLMSRFMTFPDTNVTVAMVDRLNLQTLFRLAGNDYSFPDVWGYTRTLTNGTLRHEISLMSALPRRWVEATCAHEYTHAWVRENISAAREKTLGRDAEEGLCELISFLLMDARHAESQKEVILKNAYTRGQINLFLDAHTRYGLNDILDWVRFGSDKELSWDDPTRVRRLETAGPARPAGNSLVFAPPPPTDAPTNLVLRAVLWNPQRPSAIINGRTFFANEEGKVRLGATNVMIRCQEIRQNGARIRLLGSGEELDLKLVGRK